MRQTLLLKMSLLKLVDNWKNLKVAEAAAQAAVDAQDARRKARGKPQAYRLRYTGPETRPGTVNIHLVPLLWQPFPARNLIVGKDECPTCNIIHPCKTVHLWLDAQKTVLVSQGVYDSLLKAGLEMNLLELVGGTDKPPPLRINGRVSRRQVDQENETIRQWSNNG